MKISNEAKVGFLALTAMLMLYFGFNFLKGTDIFSNANDYVAIFDNVSGLQPSSPVKINGVQVGRVKSTAVLPDQNNKVLVVFDIKKNIPIYAGSRVTMSSDILGGSTLLMTLAKKGRLLIEGDTLPSESEKGLQALFQEKAALIQEKALPVLKNVDSLILTLNRTLMQYDKSGYAVTKLLGTTDQTAQGLNELIAQNKQAIALAMTNLGTLSKSLIETEKGIKPIMDNLKTTTDSLKAMKLQRTLNEVNNTVVSLQKTMKSLDEGQGTAGKLLKDDQLYNNLNRTVVSLNKLMTNFREQPKRYVNFSVFGKKDKGPIESKLDSTNNP